MRLSRLPVRFPTNLGHDDVLALLDELVLGLHDGLQELQILDVPAVSLSAVDEVLDHALVDLAAQLEVIHEDVLHGDGLQNLREQEKKEHWKDVRGGSRRPQRSSPPGSGTG